MMIISSRNHLYCHCYVLICMTKEFSERIRPIFKIMSQIFAVELDATPSVGARVSRMYEGP